MTSDNLFEILNKFRSGLAELLGDQLEAVYLYGSQARGEARFDSDIDVLIILRDEFDYFEMVKQTSYLAADLSLEYETVISCVFVTTEKYKMGQTPLMINIQREGIPV